MKHLFSFALQLEGSREGLLVAVGSMAVRLGWDSTSVLILWGSFTLPPALVCQSEPGRLNMKATPSMSRASTTI